MQTLTKAIFSTVFALGLGQVANAQQVKLADTAASAILEQRLAQEFLAQNFGLKVTAGETTADLAKAIGSLSPSQQSLALQAVNKFVSGYTPTAGLTADKVATIKAKNLQAAKAAFTEPNGSIKKVSALVAATTSQINVAGLVQPATQTATEKSAPACGTFPAEWIAAKSGQSVEVIRRLYQGGFLTRSKCAPTAGEQNEGWESLPDEAIVNAVAIALETEACGLSRACLISAYGKVLNITPDQAEASAVAVGNKCGLEAAVL